MWFRSIFRRNPGRRTSLQPEQGAVSLPYRVFTRLEHLRIRSSRHLRGTGAGQRRSSRRRPAADFREHRKYVAGDDVRFVDWKASARSEQVFLKQGELPQETTVHLLLDTSASMAWGVPPKSRAALRLASALGYLALSSEDRLHFLPLRSDSPGPGASKERLTLKGKGQFPVFWNALTRIRFGGRCSLSDSVQELKQHHRGGVVLLLSDLLDIPDLAQSLAMLPRPAWEVTVLQTLHPDELQPPLNGNFLLSDVETGREVNYDVNERARSEYRDRLAAWRSSLEMTCIEHKALLALVSTGASLEREILPHLLRIHVLEQAG